MLLLSLLLLFLFLPGNIGKKPSSNHGNVAKVAKPNRNEEEILTGISSPNSFTTLKFVPYNAAAATNNHRARHIAAIFSSSTGSTTSTFTTTTTSPPLSSLMLLLLLLLRLISS